MVRRQQDFWAGMAALRGKFAFQTQRGSFIATQIECLPSIVSDPGSITRQTRSILPPKGCA